MLAIREDFEKFYVARHHGRRLTYIPSFGTCVVRAQFPSVSSLTPALLPISFLVNINPLV